MSTTQDAEDGAEVESISEDTLLPVRINKKRQCYIGNETESLSGGGSGFTKTIVYATAESIMKCSGVSRQDQNILAQVLGDEYLEFDSYDEELESRHGRSAVEIVVEEGTDAYEALGDKAPDSPYLYAAVYEVNVWEAAQKLDAEPPVAIEVEDSIKKVGGGYRTPDMISAAIKMDGEIYEQDLREFVPDLDWVIDNWSDLGGRSRGRYVDSSSKNEGKILELAVEPEGSIVDSAVYREDGTTIHHIREVEHSVVDDQSDQLRAICGVTFSFANALRLDLDVGRIDTDSYSSFTCGNCAKWTDY